MLTIYSTTESQMRCPNRSGATTAVSPPKPHPDPGPTVPASREDSPVLRQAGVGLQSQTREYFTREK